MKNHFKYRDGIITMFDEYRNNKISLNELIKYLQNIDYKIRSEYKRNYPNKGIWFHFFKDDTIVNTPLSIYYDLNGNNGNINRLYMISCIDTAIANNNEFQIYFS